jgi:hypothetical protein
LSSAFIIRRAFRRIIRSWLSPSSFLIEFNIQYDTTGPLILGILYFIFGIIYMALRTSATKLDYVIIFLNGSLNLIEFIFTPLILLAFISIYKTKIHLKRDFALICYSFSIRNILYAINIFLGFIYLFLYNNSIISFIAQLILIVSITWSLTLQYYYLRADKGIRSFSLLFVVLLEWMTVFTILQIISYSIERLGFYKTS